MGSPVLRELERKLEALETHPVAAPRSTASTGLPHLDALLPEGGLPRGRAIQWWGGRSCGKSAVLRSTLVHLREHGESVALVDAGRTLFAPDWEALRGESPFWVVRPPRSEEALWCVDLLLRSGAFDAVALGTTGPPAGREDIPRRIVVRLQRLAEEAGSLFIVMGRLPLAALRLRFRPGRLEPVPDPLFGPRLPAVRPVWVGLDRGRAEEIPVLCPISPDRTLRPFFRDRKGPRRAPDPTPE